MKTLKLNPPQFDELYGEMTLNPELRARNRCLIVYLRAKGFSRIEVADIARVDEDSVTNYTLSGHVFGFAENSWKFMVIKVSILDLKLVPSSEIQVSILFLKVSKLS